MIVVKIPNLFRVTISFYFNFQVTWCNETRPIARFNHDHQISLTRGGTWLHLFRGKFILR